MMVAAAACHVDTMLWFQNRGAEPRFRDKEGSTALELYVRASEKAKANAVAKATAQAKAEKRHSGWNERPSD